MFGFQAADEDDEGDAEAPKDADTSSPAQLLLQHDGSSATALNQSPGARQEQGHDNPCLGQLPGTLTPWGGVRWDEVGFGMG